MDFITHRSEISPAAPPPMTPWFEAIPFRVFNADSVKPGKPVYLRLRSRRNRDVNAVLPIFPLDSSDLKTLAADFELGSLGLQKFVGDNDGPALHGDTDGNRAAQRMDRFGFVR